MTVLRPVPKCLHTVSLESVDGELCYPNLFKTSSGFNINLKENHSVFEPIEISTAWDPDVYEGLTDYCLDLSASQVFDRSVKEKRFDLVITGVSRDGEDRGLAYCAHDCRLTQLRFLEVDCEDCDTLVTLSLTLVPRYISRFVPEAPRA